MAGLLDSGGLPTAEYGRLGPVPGALLLLLELASRPGGWLFTYEGR